MSADDRQSDLAVMDANEYKQKRRLQRILDAHDKVEDMGERAYGQYAEGVISHDGKNIRILRAVQQYIREVYNLLMEYDSELEEDEINEYWVGTYLGALERDHEEDIYFRGLKTRSLRRRDLYGGVDRGGPSPARAKPSCQQIGDSHGPRDGIGERVPSREPVPQPRETGSRSSSKN